MQKRDFLNILNAVGVDFTHSSSPMVQQSILGLPYQPIHWNDPLEWILLGIGALIIIFYAYLAYNAQHRGKTRYHNQIAVMLWLNFCYLSSFMLYRYLPNPPSWIDYMDVWFLYAFISFSIYLQFDFFACILILARVDSLVSHHLVHRLFHPFLSKLSQHGLGQRSTLVAD